MLTGERNAKSEIMRKRNRLQPHRTGIWKEDKSNHWRGKCTLVVVYIIGFIVAFTIVVVVFALADVPDVAKSCYVANRPHK